VRLPVRAIGIISVGSRALRAPMACVPHVAPRQAPLRGGFKSQRPHWWQRIRDVAKHRHWRQPQE
jgi:hypothetical protein